MHPMYFQECRKTGNHWPCLWGCCSSVTTKPLTFHGRKQVIYTSPRSVVWKILLCKEAIATAMDSSGQRMLNKSAPARWGLSFFLFRFIYLSFALYFTAFFKFGTFDFHNISYHLNLDLLISFLLFVTYINLLFETEITLFDYFSVSWSVSILHCLEGVCFQRDYAKPFQNWDNIHLLQKFKM